MLEVKIWVDAPEGQAIGIKEDLAMYLERFGKAKVVSVKPISVEERLREIDWSGRQTEMNWRGDRIP